jgi:hypothetical protein
MMADRPAPGQPDPTSGLCATCRFAETIISARGSRFLLCLRSKTDPDFAKYPRLPVLRCSGYEIDSLG